MSEPDAMWIRGTTAGLRTLVDDTVAVTLHFSPVVAGSATSLFRVRGIDVVCALVDPKQALDEEQRLLIEMAERQGTGHD